MDLNTVHEGIQKRESGRRVGRGAGCNKGKQSGRGSNGQKSRSGFSMSPAFEGGQMPLSRRIPKRGFNNAKYGKDVESVTLASIVAKFPESCQITREVLLERGLIKRSDSYIKIIGNDKLETKYDFSVHFISKGAAKSVEEIGGKVEILPLKNPVVKNKMKPKAKKD